MIVFLVRCQLQGIYQFYLFDYEQKFIVTLKKIILAYTSQGIASKRLVPIPHSTPLTGPPFHGPMVVVLTGFHCICNHLRTFSNNMSLHSF